MPHRWDPVVVMRMPVKLNAVPADNNTSQNHTSLDANNVLDGRDSDCVFTDADNRNKQRFDDNFSLHVSSVRLSECVSHCLFLMSCLGDVLQRFDPGHCHQAGARTRRQQI